MNFNLSVLNAAASKNLSLWNKTENNVSFATSQEVSSCGSFTASHDVPPTKSVYDNLDVQSFFSVIEETKKYSKKARAGADFALKAHKLLNQAKELIKYRENDSDNFGENLLARFEDLIALISGLATSTSTTNFMAILHLYIRTHYTGSLALSLWNRVNLILSNIKTNFTSLDSSILDQQSAEESDSFQEVIDFLRSAIMDWKTHKGGTLATKLTDLINLLVTFGFFPSLETEPLRLGVFTLFQAKAWDIQKNSTSFFEVVFDTLLFFIERGYSAFKHQDITLLWYSDKDAADFDSEYSTLVSALPLLEAGKLKELGDEFANEQEFEVRLEALICSATSNLKIEKYPAARTVLTNRLVVLKKVRVALIMAAKRSPIREKPYGVAIFGGSAVGKSCLNSVITKVLLSANNFPSTKEYIVTLNDSDKYQSEYRACHTGVTMDDYGNTKAEHYSESPTGKIIDFLNNVPKAALNPNVELKGNIMIKPKVVTLTTNVKTLLAHTFSNEPVSILRRFNVFLDVRLKPECVDPETGGLNADTVKGFVPDCWLIDVQRVKIIRSTVSTNKDGHEFVTLLKDASLFEALEFMKTDSRAHFAKQDTFVKSTEELFDMELCPHSYCPSECPLCKKLDKQNGTEYYFDSDCFFDEEKFVESDLEHSVIEGETLPQRIEASIKAWYVDHGVDKLEYVKQSYKSFADVLADKKAEVLKATCAALGITVTIFALVKVFKMLTTTEEFVSHGCEEQVPQRMETDVPNPWKKVSPVRIPKTAQSASTPFEALTRLLSHHMGHAYLYDKESHTRKKCDIIPIGRNDWILPAHMLEDKVYTIEVQTTRRDTLGKNFKETIDSSCWVPMGADFALVRLVNGGDVYNFSKFLLPDDFALTSKVFASILFKNPEGIITEDVVQLQEKKKFTSVATTFEGVSYQYPRETFPGLCMAPIIPHRNGSSILGFHLAGRNGTSFGVAGILLKNDYDRAFIHLNSQYPLVSHSSGNFSTSKYGIDFTPVTEVQQRHACKWQQNDEDDEQPVLTVYGSHTKGTAKFKSQVQTSPISDAVTKIMDLPRVHGPPCSKKIGQHWSRDLTQMAHPKGSFEPKILSLARDDLRNKIQTFLTENPKKLDMVHPYPKDYVLSGMDGVTSVDRVELNSSMGWPLNKKKSFFMEVVDREVEGVTEPIDFIDPQYWDESLRMEAALAAGERVYVIHRGNLKDEPTKFTKIKIRVFAGCEFAFTCLVRKYYLPIVRLIQSNWIDFECGVGINAHSRQWHELKEFVTRYGEERMIAGDYKAFDKAVTPLIMMSSFDLLIGIAQRAGYTSRQIEIMRGIATEICYPLYELDGVFVQVYGSNPSGHPLTVIINNLNNSIYLRYAYYALHKDEKVPQFDQRVALMCYGDDNAMSVASEEKLFNHTSVSNELNKVGITYTMADKEAASVPFLPLSEISFLKRGFVWSEDVQSFVAPIEVSSISKSLHNFMSRKGVETLPEEISANALLAANMEFYYHGREIFEERRAQILQVAESSGITSYLTNLQTYDDLTDRFNGNTVKRDMLDESDVPLDCQNGVDVLYEDDLKPQIISDFGIKPVVDNRPMGCMSFGAPDLVFRYTGSNKDLIIAIELKILNGRAHTAAKRSRAVRQQAYKYSRAFSILVPTAVVVGLTYTEFGYGFVSLYNGKNMPLSQILKFLPLEEEEVVKLKECYDAHDLFKSEN